MEENDTRSSFGSVIMDVGKEICPRTVVSSAVMQHVEGNLIHIWGLDDGETVVINQDPKAKKSVISHATVLVKGESSWKSWRIEHLEFDQVLESEQAKGYRIKSVKTPKQSNLQMPLLAQTKSLS